MIIKSKLTKEQRDSFATPQELFEKCCKLWNLKPNLDVCATFDNSKCERFFDIKTNALDKNCNWLIFDNRKTIVWCNPPHSKTNKFVEKAFEQWKRFNTNIIMIIPLNTLSSNYAFEFIHGFAEIKFLKGRPSFIHPITNEISKHNAVNGYVTICYKEK